MAFDYYYFVSSLPTLKINDTCGMSSSRFLDLCDRLIDSQRDLHVIKFAKIESFNKTSRNLILVQWRNYETEIRNQLVILRARRLERCPDTYLRGESFDVYIRPEIVELFSASTPLDSEDKLFRLRWFLFERLGRWEHYNLNAIILYYLKLQLLERKQRMTKSNGRKVVEGLL